MCYETLRRVPSFALDLREINSQTRAAVTLYESEFKNLVKYDVGALVFCFSATYIKPVMRLSSFAAILSIIILLLAATAFAEIIKDRPTALSNGSDIILRWNTVDEAGVQRFEVLRRAGTEGDFSLVGAIEQLKGNNSSYEYIDKSVFKANSGVYQYKIRIINGTNPAPETEVVSVSHLSSAAKRTWGSIKAMFR